MNTDKSLLRVAVPWNSSCYIPCNGFHPLYQALFDDGAGSPIAINVLDEPRFAELLGDNDCLQQISENVVRQHKQLEAKWAKYSIANKFIEHIGVDDLWLNSHLPGDIELHHTCPLTTAERPFVIHCESFLPIFMPFAYQGAGFMQNVDEVRDFYTAILADDNCLGIYSHLQITLDQISRFFKNPQIDSKLELTRIGLAENTYNELAAKEREPWPEGGPCFLFTSSAHQQQASFNLRGGGSVLLFAERYLREGRKAQFLFRCGRPRDYELEEFGINIAWLHEAENDQKIIWIEGFLPENEQLSLFKLADFFLMPSVNLHSVSLMQAQLAGAIPVVTDTYGTDRFVEDGRTGIVLEGVRDIVWQSDPVTGVPCDDHQRWTKELATQLAALMYERVIGLIKHHETFSQIRAGMRVHALANYSGEKFREEFFENVFARLPAELVNKEGPFLKSEFPLLKPAEREFRQLFRSPPVAYLILSGECANIYSHRGCYWSVPFRKHQNGLQNWSLIYNGKQGLLGVGNLQISWTLSDLVESLLREGPNYPLKLLFKIERRAKKIVEGNPVLRKVIRKFYPLIKRALFLIERIVTQEKTS